MSMYFTDRRQKCTHSYFYTLALETNECLVSILKNYIFLRKWGTIFNARSRSRKNPQVAEIHKCPNKRITYVRMYVPRATSFSLFQVGNFPSQIFSVSRRALNYLRTFKLTRPGFRAGSARGRHFAPARTQWRRAEMNNRSAARLCGYTDKSKKCFFNSVVYLLSVCIDAYSYCLLEK